jgi:hypothetical protein
MDACTHLYALCACGRSALFVKQDDTDGYDGECTTCDARYRGITLDGIGGLTHASPQEFRFLDADPRAVAEKAEPTAPATAPEGMHFYAKCHCGTSTLFRERDGRFDGTCPSCSTEHRGLTTTDIEGLLPHPFVQEFRFLSRQEVRELVGER